MPGSRPTGRTTTARSPTWRRPAADASIARRSPREVRPGRARQASQGAHAWRRGDRRAARSPRAFDARPLGNLAARDRGRRQVPIAQGSLGRYDDAAWRTYGHDPGWARNVRTAPDQGEDRGRKEA